MKRKGFTPASSEQREKVRRRGYCRGCGGMDIPLDASHNVPRGLGGCDSEDCITPLCRRCHTAYEQGKLDVLPFLTLEEQAHAVWHLGIIGALERLTGERWGPKNKGET